MTNSLENILDGPTKIVAQRLLGLFLIHDSPEGITAGRITETEAYLGSRDPASHAYRGPTPRNSSMYKRAGHAYVYFTYGVHYMFNVSTRPEGTGEGVLIRALEPLAGLDLMYERRRTGDRIQLTNGPAKLVQAMGIGKPDNGCDLLAGGALRLAAAWKDMSWRPVAAVAAGPRIGISQGQDLPLRFFIPGTPFVSQSPQNRQAKVVRARAEA